MICREFEKRAGLKEIDRESVLYLRLEYVNVSKEMNEYDLVSIPTDENNERAI